MSQTLVNRARTLLNGQVTDFVQALEKGAAERVMRKTISDLETTADEIRTEISRLSDTRHDTERHIQAAKSKIDEVAEGSEIAIDDGRISLKSLFEQSRKETDGRVNELNGLVAELNGRQSELESELSSYFAQRAAISAAAAGLDHQQKKDAAA